MIKPLLRFLLSAGLAFCAAYGAAGCLLSAFTLEVPSLSLLLGVWAAASAVSAGLFSLKRGGWLVMLGCLGFGYWLGHETDFLTQLWQLVYRITHVYNKAYHWGVFRLVETPWDAGTAELPLMALGALAAIVTAWAVCRRKSSVYPALAALLPLGLCVVVTGTVPEVKYLYLLLLSQCLLVLSGYVRRQDGHQSDRLVLMAALPTALALALLFWAVPEESYANPTAQWQESLRHWFRQETVLTEGHGGTPGKKAQTVDLAHLGSRRSSTAPVMEVTAKTGGSLYLRLRDYDRYDGKGWASTPNRVEPFEAKGTNLGYVSVTTRRQLEDLYLPYYPRGGLSLIGGSYGNTRLAKEYTFLRQGLPENVPTEVQPPFAPGADSVYRSLPRKTEEAAREMALPLISPQMNAREMAEAIGLWLREVGTYETEVAPMPEGEGDFALWFLNSGKQGYCVHFATAATVLLRSVGIEARYVSGYLIALPPETTVTVTEAEAHAWAEYYDPAAQVWRILEATPPEGLPEEMSLPTDAPLPPETVPPTVPTRPETEPQPPTEEPLPQPPAADPPEVPAQEAQRRPFPWVPVLVLLALYLALEGQRQLRLAVHNQRLRRGDPNRRSLILWNRALRLSRHLDIQPPESLKALAEKAKFSPHTLTVAELNQFDQYLREAKGQLREKPWYFRLLHRYLFALY